VNAVDGSAIKVPDVPAGNSGLILFTEAESEKPVFKTLSVANSVEISVVGKREEESFFHSRDDLIVDFCL
jgi:hypothetical protein